MISEFKNKPVKKVLFFLFFLAFPVCMSRGWGFFGHQRINRLAVFCLPPEMLGFYKYNITYLTENAVSPDKRRYAVPGEAPRHYIDMDVYGDSAFYKLPHYWKDAVARYTEDTLMAYGIVPWHINRMRYELTDAMQKKQILRMLRLSADLGHYIADANVPLHTTQNYNGQRTNQIGIHGFWESRLVELFSDKYDFFVGQAQYLKRPQETAWLAVKGANAALDSVLTFEKELNGLFPEDKKYSFEQRGNVTMKVYSKAYSKAYHDKLGGQVERQMRASVKMIADFWYTCWVDAGQPDLQPLAGQKFSEEELKWLQEEKNEIQKQEIPARPHETDNTSFLLDDRCCRQFLALTPAAIRKRQKLRN